MSEPHAFETPHGRIPGQHCEVAPISVVRWVALEPRGIWGGTTADENSELLARTAVRLARWQLRSDLGLATR
jgi:hypothetical protein